MSILTKIRNFNQLVCGTIGHDPSKPTAFLDTTGTAICGYKRKCKRCSHEVKEYADADIVEYPRLS